MHLWQGNENIVYIFVFNDCVCICFVQLDESNANRLVLRSITAETAGRFRCEVSAEAPSFETVSGHADMTVVSKYHYFIGVLYYSVRFPDLLLYQRTHYHLLSL